MLASDLPAWFVRVFAFAFGAVWGSFANVVIYRWPREMSVVHPGSHCFACGAPVRAYDNVPILAWLWLRGRCRACGARISPRYAVVELLFAVVSLAIASRAFGLGLGGADDATGAAAALSVQAAFGHYVVRFVVAGVLLVATFIDLDEMIVPSFVKYFAAVPLLGALVLPPLPPTVGPVLALAGAGAGYLGLRILFIDGYKLLTGRRGMGLGDAEILLLVGALLGPWGVLFTLGAGAVQGVVATAIAMVLRARIGPEHADLIDEEDDADDADADGDEAHDAHEQALERRDVSAASHQDDEPTRAPAVGEPSASQSGPTTTTTTTAMTTTEADEGEGADEGVPVAHGARRLRAKVPFVPFLALAALEYLLGADALFNAYLRLVRGE